MVEFLGSFEVNWLEFWLALRPKHRPLVFRDCKVVTDKFLPVSDFEMLNVYYLNKTHGFGAVTFELTFDPANAEYGKFYMQRIALKTSSGFEFKGDKLTNFKDFAFSNYTKVNKNGQLVLSVRYFFTSAEERDQFLASETIIFEGFLAIRSRSNTYGFITKMARQDDAWQLVEGDTYRIYSGVNLNNLQR